MSSVPTPRSLPSPVASTASHARPDGAASLRRRAASVSAALVALTLAACSSVEVSGPDNQPTAVQLVATVPVEEGSASEEPAGVVVRTDGENDLTVIDAEFVMRRIDLLPQGRTEDCPETQPDEPGEGDCMRFAAGPGLVPLPTEEGAAQLLTIPVEPQTYDRFAFQLYPPESGNPDDDAFLQQVGPGYDGVSVRATGSFNGAPFTFTLGPDPELVRELAPPIELVGDGDFAVVVLDVDVGTWFEAEDGGLIDPEQASDEERTRISENVSGSVTVSVTQEEES